MYTHTNYRGITYSLVYKDVNLRGGRLYRLYFFCLPANVGKLGVACDLPADKEVHENMRNGFLTVTNKKDLSC